MRILSFPNIQCSKCYDSLIIEIRYADPSKLNPLEDKITIKHLPNDPPYCEDQNKVFEKFTRDFVVEV